MPDDSPISARNRTDPGDEVIRKFRYQFAYGVILLTGAATGRLAYKELWCEQHEDLLAQHQDGKFDAYQIKTRKPETGAWELNDDALVKSVHRFAKLNKQFPGQIRKFVFVSNADFSDSDAANRRYLSPVKLMSAVANVNRWEDLPADAKRGFNELLGAEDLTEVDFFETLQRLELVRGPTDRAFEDELAQSHLPTLGECSGCCASTLATIREALIAKVAEASSLFADSPERHWVALNNTHQQEPLLLAKRITVDDIKLIVREIRGPSFKYLPSLASLQLGSANRQTKKLKAKMLRGGLAHHYEIMQRRTLSAESALLEMATRPDAGQQICSQIENVVYGECSDAHLRASQQSNVFGPKMLMDVQDRLKQIAANDPDRVYRLPYDALVGVAGLLTSECKVWWSETFDLESLQ